MVNAGQEFRNWGERYNIASAKVSTLQNDKASKTLELQSEPDKIKNEAIQRVLQAIQSVIGLWTILQSDFKSFMDYWKDRIDDDKVALKNALGLAASARG